MVPLALSIHEEPSKCKAGIRSSKKRKPALFRAGRGDGQAIQKFRAASAAEAASEV